MNPFISFCLYVSARVFVQYLKTRPEDDHGKSSLQFLLKAMEALKKKNPLTSSFLVQLDVDIQGSGLKDRHSDNPFGGENEAVCHPGAHANPTDRLFANRTTTTVA
jgi:hypothetical protein